MSLFHNNIWVMQYHTPIPVFPQLKAKSSWKRDPNCLKFDGYSMQFQRFLHTAAIFSSKTEIHNTCIRNGIGKLSCVLALHVTALIPEFLKIPPPPSTLPEQHQNFLAFMNFEEMWKPFPTPISRRNLYPSWERTIQIQAQSISMVKNKSVPRLTIRNIYVNILQILTQVNCFPLKFMRHLYKG